MKNYLLGYIFLGSLLFLPVKNWAQVAQDFESIATALNCSDVTCHYTDSGDASMFHVLEDANGVPVSQSPASGVLGFITDFTPSRIGGSANGLTDGDAFGVAEGLALSSNLGVSAQSGTKAFLMEDTDGWVTISFTEVDLNNAGSASFSMHYFIDDSSYEVSDGANDRLYIRLELTNCASPQTISLLDTDGGGSGGGGGNDIDSQGIEDSWNQLTADLSAFTACTAQLIVEVDVNSSSEEMAIDNISFSAGTVLPVELIDISATVKPEGIMLEWATATEENNDYFLLERSTDGRGFEPIGRVVGQGTSSQINYYQFLDESPLLGQSYYRLRQVDFDGSQHLSDVLSVRLPQSGLSIKSTAVLSPVPVVDQLLRVTMSDPPTGISSVALFDSYGRMIKRYAFEDRQSSFELRLPDLASGMYYLQLGQTMSRFVVGE